MNWKVLFFILLAAASSGALANDGTYYTQGNQLVPLQETDISVRREVLTISLGDDGYARVDVRYEFWNPSKTVKRVMMGFEAEPPYNDDYTFHPDGAHPNIKFFTVEMNGHRLEYRHIACYRDSLPLVPIDTTKRYYVWDDNTLHESHEGKENYPSNDEVNIVFAYIYTFEAEFQPGLNTVHHTYTYRVSTAAGIPWLLEYKLSPASRWAGGKIDDFTLVVRTDSTAKHFTVLKNALPGAEFALLEGSGKMRHNKLASDPCYEISMRNGAIQWHIKDFRPKNELFVACIDVYSEIDGPYRLGYSYDRWSTVHLWEEPDETESTDEAFRKRIMRNLPYAHRGYVFRDPKLKAYFESLWWYMPDPEYKASDTDFTEVDRIYIKNGM